MAGSADPGALPAASLAAAAGLDAVLRSQSGLVADMDRAADVLYARETSAAAAA